MNHRYARWQDMATVQYRNGQPAGEPQLGTVRRVDGVRVLVRLAAVHRTHGRANSEVWVTPDVDGFYSRDGRTYRLVAVCNRAECERPTLDPYTEAGDPLQRQWCSEDCHETEAEAYWTARWAAC